MREFAWLLIGFGLGIMFHAWLTYIERPVQVIAEPVFPVPSHWTPDYTPDDVEHDAAWHAHVPPDPGPQS